MPRNFRLRNLLLMLVLVAAPTPAAWAADLAYATDIRLEGAEDKKLLDTLKGASELLRLKDQPPPTEAALRRRVESDVERLTGVAQAEGYWRPTIRYEIDTRESPAKVTLTVAPGPLFHYEVITFRTSEGGPPPLLNELGSAAVGLSVGAPARSAPVAEAERRIVDLYAQNGRPFAQVTDRKAIVDVATNTMAVTYTVEPGPEVRFGAAVILGLKTVDRAFVVARIAWHTDTPYDSRQVEKTRQDLIKTNLFSEVRITHGDMPASGNQVPVIIDLQEGPAHSVSAGVGYNTNLGLGATASWEDRNLFGGAEDLRLSAGVAQRQLGLFLSFRKPDFLERDQTFLTTAEVLRLVTPAFRSRREDAVAAIERPLLPSLVGDLGLSLERANVTEEFRSENYTLLGIPLVLRRDTTDNLLDPTLGSRETLTVTPYHGLATSKLNFVTTRLEGRDYERLDETGRFLLAGYAALGSILGEGRDALPADKRFYAGGAGSVRGYAFQRAGPLGPANTPLGGASSVELGVELRYRITDTIGVVPFFEGGNVYPHSFPDSVKLFYGAGIGLRYYTVIGPVRLDLATPLDRRASDSPIQFYISIGQAF